LGAALKQDDQALEAFVVDMERLVSKPRLDKYRPTDRNDLETIATYLWNVSLSEALLQGISAFEIALRNAIHNSFTVHAGTDMWFWAMLQKQDIRVINDKWMKLAEVLRRPPTSGKLIADLTFGFWPYLFEKRYNSLWQENGEALLRSVFPHGPFNVAPHLKINRSELLRRLNLFVDTRNRVMHHEFILLGVAQPDMGSPAPIVPIDDVHQQLIETLSWISPQASLALSFVDRFPDVFHNEQQRIRVRIATHFETP
jgi:hypothetical protein